MRVVSKPLLMRAEGHGATCLRREDHSNLPRAAGSE